VAVVRLVRNNDRAMAVQVRFFAAARELAGCESDSVELAEQVSHARFSELLGQRHPRLRGYLSRMRFAVNGELHPPQDRAIRDGDDVDVLPPVAGGSGSAHPSQVTLADIRSEPLSLDECVSAVSHPSAGGIATFTGVVRDHAEGGAVARLDYEAHPELARAEMLRVLQQVAGEYPGVRLAATHRIGALEIGDLAVVVAASAAHRAEAFEACRSGIDRIKETVPIWKKEWAPDGTAHWVNLAGC
jgi:molybdopterin synthase catalytic subunit/molybdopterin converting factor small subunit